MIPGGVILVGFVLLLIVSVTVIALNVFWRLSYQQRQIDALDARIDSLTDALARNGRERPREEVQREAMLRLAAMTLRAKPTAPHQLQPVAGDESTGPPAATARADQSLETRIGSRGLLYVGVVAIVLGVAYFEKLAFENRWVSETARVIQGGLAGLALIYAGIRFARAGYRTYGQMISGCGSAILYLSTYAAFNFYHLIGRPMAFGLMIAITSGTALLADRQRSQGLAVLAASGGFATPFMLPGTGDQQLAVFGYDTVLIAGTVALSTRRDWPLLDVGSYVFTLLTVVAWAIDFYAPQKFFRTEVFLTIFCAMFLTIVYAHRRSTSPGVTVATWVLWTAAPVYWIASVAVLGDHPTAMLVWLVCAGLAAAILTAAASVTAALWVWMATALPLLLWCTMHPSRAWLTPGLVTLATVYATALAAQLYREAERLPFGGPDVVWLHLNGLLMFAGAYILIDATRTSAAAPVAAAFAAWHGALAAGLLARDRDRALHFAGVAFTLLMIAIGLEFDGPAVTIGWAAEGAVVIALGLRERREWLRTGGAALFFVALARTADLLVDPAPIHQRPIVNTHAACAAFVVLLCYGLAWMHARDGNAPRARPSVAAALIAAQLVTVMLITSEIDAYWSAPGDALTRELAISVAWAVYATVLIVVGLRRDSAAIRYFAILVFALTTAKVFFIDTAQLERVYRILSVLGLGVALLVTSYLYHRTHHRAIDDLNGRI